MRAARGGSAAVLERLRAICLSFDGAVERLSHGEPTWFTAEKGRVFAMYDDHHHGAPHVSVWVPAPLEVQRALVAAEPERYWVPPYVGPKGWVAIVLDGRPDWAVVRSLVGKGFEQVARPPARRRR